MKAIYVIMALLSFYLMAGCSLMKSTTRNKEQTLEQVKDEHNLTALSATENTLDSQRLTVKRDSVNDSYALRLYPNGEMIYTLGSGFSGKFDSVLVRGNYQKQGSELNKAMQKQHESKQVAVQDKQKKQQNRSAKALQVKRIPDVKVIIAVVVLVAAVLVFVKKRYFS